MNSYQPPQQTWWDSYPVDWSSQLKLRKPSDVRLHPTVFGEAGLRLQDRQEIVEHLFCIFLRFVSFRICLRRNSVALGVELAHACMCGVYIYTSILV